MCFASVNAAGQRSTSVIEGDGLGVSDGAKMTITNEDDLDGLKVIGRIVANTMQAMAKAMEPGMTTKELDEIGRALLENAGAVSAPQSTYDFPGATCISVNEEIAHGIPVWRSGHPARRSGQH